MTTVTESLTKAGIIPDMIESFDASESLQKSLVITFPTGESVKMGNILPPKPTHTKPTITWEADEGPKTLYTLIKSDPDAPSRADPKFREWCHYIHTNIEGNDLSTGEVVYGYVGVGAPKDTGLHRYVYFLFQQEGKVTLTDTVTKSAQNADNRGGFHVAEFAKKNNLGQLVSVNFYESEYDESVDDLYKTFTDHDPK
eukprot:TRINITY_DN700_c0_g1_i1.p2 TRINITY_DN700_c0_g1~~TRINITY_DN700_c0_g1_i1.p2  ORF type:complete len:220 (+),score=65.88 TRINITY_DN700_c0_g1_i1:69-662(+)